VAKAIALKVLKDFGDLSYLAGSVVEVSPTFARFLVLHHPDCFEVIGVGSKELNSPPADKMMRPKNARTK
jgi:hypothetical protein